MMILKSLALASWVSFIAFPAAAQPSSSASVVDGLASSDLVVAGRESIAPVSNGGAAHLTISVDRIIKGSTTPVKMIDLGLPPTGLALTAPKYRVFFLHGDSGKFGLDQEIYGRMDGQGMVVASPFPYIVAANDAQPLERLATEFANVLLLSEHQAADPALGTSIQVSTTREFVGYNADGSQALKWQPPSPSHQAEFTYARAEGALRKIPYEARKKALSEVVDRNQPGLGKVWALASMIAGGDISKAIKHEDDLVNLPPEAGVTGAALFMAFHLFVSGDPDDIPKDNTTLALFQQLARSHNLEVKKGALFVLSRIGTPDAVRSIGAQINDPDPDIRILAVKLICEATKNCDYHNARELADARNIAAVTSELQTWLAHQSQ